MNFHADFDFDLEIFYSKEVQLLYAKRYGAFKRGSIQKLTSLSSLFLLLEKVFTQFFVICPTLENACIFSNCIGQLPLIILFHDESCGSWVFIINFDVQKTTLLSIKFHSLKILQIHAQFATHNLPHNLTFVLFSPHYRMFNH